MFFRTSVPFVDWLVVYLPIWKIRIRQLGWLFPIYGKIKNVPNHQPVEKYCQTEHLEATLVGSEDNEDTWLVVLTILKNISQWEGFSYILWKIKHVPNHQPDTSNFEANICCPLYSEFRPSNHLARQLPQDRSVHLGTMIPRITTGHPCEVIIIYPDLAVKMGNTEYPHQITVLIGKVWKKYTWYTIFRQTRVSLCLK